MRFPFGFDVTVERAGGWDEHGNSRDVIAHEIGKCVPDQTSTIETADGQQVVVTRNQLLCDDPDADVRHEDTLVLPDGSRWHVTGDVDRPQNPFTGWRPGCVIPIESASGTTAPQDG